MASATIERMEVEVSSVAENNVVVQKHGSVAVGGWIASSKNETYHQVSFVYFSASSTRFKGLGFIW